MRIVEKKQNRELVYELVYREQIISELIDEIIENCSIRRNGRYVIQARTYDEVRKKTDSTIFWDDIKTYENVNYIRAEEINDPCDYWRHGDPRPYSFYADALIVPELVNFLINLLNNKDIDYDWFIKRKELSKKQELELEIQRLDSEINEISNFDTERKIKKLNELSRKIKYLSELPNFDYDILTKYYSMAQECVKLELVQETIKYPRKLTRGNK